MSCIDVVVALGTIYLLFYTDTHFNIIALGITYISYRILFYEPHYPSSNLGKLRTGSMDQCKISFMNRIHKLPDNIWKTLQTDLKNGINERGHNLRIKEIYEIVNPVHNITKYIDSVSIMSKPNIRQLYHGTKTMSVESIIKEGFRLPKTTSSNMFGPGVYLACVPQKAFNYTDLNGYIIICYAALGKPKALHRAKNLDPSKDLKSSRLWGLHKKVYDSAHAIAGTSTVSDEHIIFYPERILPVYIISTYL